MLPYKMLTHVFYFYFAKSFTSSKYLIYLMDGLNRMWNRMFECKPSFQYVFHALSIHSTPYTHSSYSHNMYFQLQSSLHLFLLPEIHEPKLWFFYAIATKREYISLDLRLMIVDIYGRQNPIDS